MMNQQKIIKCFAVKLIRIIHPKKIIAWNKKNCKYFKSFYTYKKISDKWLEYLITNFT